MRAAYLVEPGHIEVREVPDPQPGHGQIVLRVECAHTCGTDLKAFRRGHPFIRMPGRFGHQYAGRVAAVGAEVDGLEPAMPVWGVHSAPCGECDACGRNRPNLCVRLAEQLVLGAFSEYLLIPDRVVQKNIWRRHEHVTARRAAFLEPVACVVHGLRCLDLAGVDRILVLGLGSMGLLFGQIVRQFSRASVVAAGRHPCRLELARSMGFEQVVDIDQGGGPEVLGPLGRFDCVIECTGRPEGWHHALDSVRPGGQVELFGGLPKGSRIDLDTYRLHYEEVRLLGSFHFGPGDVRQAAELLESDQVRVEPLITQEMPLERLPAALESMASGQAIKCEIDPWS